MCKSGFESNHSQGMLKRQYWNIPTWTATDSSFPIDKIENVKKMYTFVPLACKNFVIWLLQQVPRWMGSWRLTSFNSLALYSYNRAFFYMYSKTSSIFSIAVLLYIFYTKCFPEYSYTVLQQPDSKYCQKQKACPLLAHRRKLSKKSYLCFCAFFLYKQDMIMRLMKFGFVSKFWV